MKAFRFVRPLDAEQVDTALAKEAGALLKASGVDVLDRMKERVATPDVVIGLVDTAGIADVALTEDGSLHLGAGVTLDALAQSPVVQQAAPSLARAAGMAASPQIRHRATLGGNLGQHTRCGYYRHASFPCLKRGGSVCPVREEGGVQDTAGIFDNGACASGHPSSVAPVLGSLDAVLVVRSSEGVREVPFAEAWASPKAGRADDLDLGAGSWIESVLVPPVAGTRALGYEEVRHKQAFDWALVSAGVAVHLEGGKVRDARVWLGSVAPTPWRARAAEQALIGKAWGADAIAAAAEAATEGATPLPGTSYKTRLTRVAVKRALEHAAESSR